MTTPMTLEGEQQLRDELARLKSEIRPRIVKDIAIARGHGDLKENAEYHAAKEEQGFTEGRIQEIEAKLSDAQVIDISRISPMGRVIFGSTVTLSDPQTRETVCYKIVGEDESDIKDSKISVMSPIARAMMGKSEGDAVVAITPNGEREYEIDRVEHV